MNTSSAPSHEGMGGFLGWVERSGNKGLEHIVSRVAEQIEIA